MSSRGFFIVGNDLGHLLVMVRTVNPGIRSMSPHTRLEIITRTPSRLQLKTTNHDEFLSLSRLQSG
jgi:hypothetical protein